MSYVVKRVKRHCPIFIWWSKVICTSYVWDSAHSSWGRLAEARIQLFGNLSTHPGCFFLHYAAQVCTRHLEFHLCAYTPHVYPDTETGAWHCHDKCSHLLDRQTITLLYLFGSMMLFVNWDLVVCKLRFSEKLRHLSRKDLELVNLALITSRLHYCNFLILVYPSLYYLSCKLSKTQSQGFWGTIFPLY